ncbi:MAG: sodium-dependent bicarbonate transport family permease [Planctomycetaceae bacterium]
MARLAKSEIAIPKDLFTSLSNYLLFALGIKGGVELTHASAHEIVWPICATLRTLMESPGIHIALAIGALGTLTVPAASVVTVSSGGAAAYGGAGGTVLSPEGEKVYRYADEIPWLGRELLQTVKGEPQHAPRLFRVGVSDALPKLTTYKLLEPALAMQPPFRLHVRIDKTERLLGELAVHALDLVVADAPMMPSLKVRDFSHFWVRPVCRSSAPRRSPARHDGSSPRRSMAPPCCCRHSASSIGCEKSFMPSRSNVGSRTPPSG